MIQFLSVICLLVLSNEVLAQRIEPCESDELQTAFAEQNHIEYEFGDDSVSIVVTVPVELPNVRIGGLFLVREEDGRRVLHAPLAQISDTPEHYWTSVTIGKALTHDYSIAVTYHLVQTYPDACWYEFKVQIDRQDALN